jgi:hypothetical protein
MAKTFDSKPVVKTKGRDLLNATPNYQFFFMHNPNGWEMIPNDDGVFEWLPVLKRFELRPGLNGVKVNRRGGVDYVNAKARFESNGWTFILPEEIDGGYLVEYEGRRGPVYSDRFTTPRALGMGSGARIVWDFDRDAFNDWRRELKERLGEPDPSVIDMKSTIQRKRSERRAREVHIPAVAAKMEREIKKLEAMTESKPKKKRRAPRKKAEVKA